jgi:hypothetical protein
MSRAVLDHLRNLREVSARPRVVRRRDPMPVDRVRDRAVVRDLVVEHFRRHKLPGPELKLSEVFGRETLEVHAQRTRATWTGDGIGAPPRRRDGA